MKFCVCFSISFRNYNNIFQNTLTLKNLKQIHNCDKGKNNAVRFILCLTIDYFHIHEWVSGWNIILKNKS